MASDCQKMTRDRIVDYLTTSILRRINAVEDAQGVTRRSVEDLVGDADSQVFQLLLQAAREDRTWTYLFNRSTGLRMDWTPTTSDAGMVNEAVAWLDRTCLPLETGVVLTSVTETGPVAKAGLGLGWVVVALGAVWWFFRRR
jgi:hypothetical protein